MGCTFVQWLVAASLTVTLLLGGSASGAPKDLGQGFLDHGRVAPENAPKWSASVVAAGPNSIVCGITKESSEVAFYDAETDSWSHFQCAGEWRVIGRQGDRFLAAGSACGLQDWDLLRPWNLQSDDRINGNPCTLTYYSGDIEEPLDILAALDGKTVVVAGRSWFCDRGNWLVFWNRETKMSISVGQQAFLGKQWTASLAGLPDNKLIGGSTIAKEPTVLIRVPINIENDSDSKYLEPLPEIRITGGSPDALISVASETPLFFEDEFKPCVLFIMDVATKRVEWHEAIFKDAKAFTELWTGPAGLVYGLARVSVPYLARGERKQWNPKRFFVFDPAQRKVIHQQDLDSSSDLSISCDGPRSFIASNQSTLYLLYRTGVAQVDLGTHAITMLAESPVPISAGGDYLDGRIYFVSEGRLCSYTLPAP